MAATADDVAGRVNQIKAEIESTDSDWDREKLQERLAKLAGGVCVISVGAATEVELKEKKHRLEDAISATRAAVEEGIVSGGGSALVHAVKVLEGNLGKTGDEATGVAVVRRAVVEPLRWIAENAGLEGYVITAKVAELDKGQGFNAATGEYGDLVKAGVIDPVKVTRSALENAASIAVAAAHDRDPGRREAGRGRGRRRSRRSRPLPLKHVLARTSAQRLTGRRAARTEVVSAVQSRPGASVAEAPGPARAFTAGEIPEASVPDRRAAPDRPGCGSPRSGHP